MMALFFMEKGHLPMTERRRCGQFRPVQDNRVPRPYDSGGSPVIVPFMTSC